MAVYLELISSSSQICRVVRRLDFACLWFDVAVSPHSDLCWRDVVHIIAYSAQIGLVLGVWLVTPCTTWSSTCRPLVCSRACLSGLSDMPPHRVPSLMNGNKTFIITYRLIKPLTKLSIRCFLENRLTSMMLYTSLLCLMQHRSCKKSLCCMCAYVARWRKHTTILSWNCESPSLDTQICRSPGGLCMVSHKHNITVSG